MTWTRHALVEPVAALTAVGVLVLLAYQIVAPFLVSLVWASILVYVTWKPYEMLARAVRSRTLAAGLMVLAFIIIIIVPLVIAGVELSTKVDAVGRWYEQILAAGWPATPHWIASLPWAGPHIDEFWGKLGAGDPENIAKAREWGKPLVAFLLRFGAALGGGILLMLLSLFLSFFIYVSGDRLVGWLSGVLARVVGERGEALLHIAAATVRGVIYGFLGTALVQGLLAYAGYWFANVPNALSFGLVSSLLSLIPGGPSLLGLPTALWLYQQGETARAIFLAVWMVAVVGLSDNVVKPLLIGKETELPFVLIILGVAGGAIAWGVLGVFLGPTLLAVCYNVLQRWVRVGATPLLGAAPEDAPEEVPAPPAT